MFNLLQKHMHSYNSFLDCQLLLLELSLQPITTERSLARQILMVHSYFETNLDLENGLKEKHRYLNNNRPIATIMILIGQPFLNQPS